MMCFASLLGTAKPTPCEPPDWLKIAVLMPISSPRALTSAPPEFPWLIAASVWMKSTNDACGPSMLRPVALTMPSVTV